ncbi:MAG: SurA N-terminal domain-containing protein [Parcubacteria group bacterium]|nr:SurA N-terminal domain-containing protein [Parcubacteria group bacterium]
MDTNESKEVTSVSAHEPVEQGSTQSSKGVSVKTALVLAVIIILGALAFYYKGVFVAATVNGSPVSRLSVITELERSSGKATLDTIITKKLLIDEAKKQGIAVTDEDVTLEIQKIEEQIKAQGGTLDEVLLSQGMNREAMKEQITLQKKLEKLLADKIQVTDEEIAALFTDNKVTVPKGEEEKYKEQAREQIRGQKLNDAAATFIDSLKSQSSIKYFVSY